MEIKVLIIIWLVVLGSLELFNFFLLLCLCNDKSVRSVKVIRHRHDINATINYYEKRGWLVGNVIKLPTDQDFYEITFHK